MGLFFNICYAGSNQRDRGMVFHTVEIAAPHLAVIRQLAQPVAHRPCHVDIRILVRHAQEVKRLAGILQLALY